MRALTEKEVKQVDGGWIALVFAAARLGYAVYRHHKLAQAATWAGRGVGIINTTYHGMAYLDPHNN